MKIRYTLTTLVMFFALTLIASTTLAGEQIGTVTQVEGIVKLFTSPSKTLPKEDAAESSKHPGQSRALYEGEYYWVRDAKPGDRVEHGNILRTAPGGKSRVVFENGDHFNVGPATAYRVFWKKDSSTGADAQTNIAMMYGKLRGVVEKGGPRSKMTVRTRTATMGVRGTDFFIADDGSGQTEVSILRGEVEVKANAKPVDTTKPETNAEPKAKPEPVKVIQVKAGYSANIVAAVTPKPESKSESKTESKAETKAEVKAPAVAELRQTTQEDLKAIRKSSQFEEHKKEDLKQAPTQEMAAKIEKLEKKAVETTIQDIKTHDPKLFAQLQPQMANGNNKLIQSVDDLNKKTVEQMIPTAPKAPPKRKPFMSEIEDLESGAYERYFKMVE